MDYGEQASTRWGGSLTPPRPFVRTQPERADGTTYLVVDDEHRTVHSGRSLVRAEQVALTRSLAGNLHHVYRKRGDGRLSHRAPIRTYVGGQSL